MLANRLSADPGNTVLLLERGPADDSWTSRIPLFSANFSEDSSLARRLETDDQAAFGRSIEIFQGKGLGGTTRINHMFYTRGPSGQYDAWERNGAEGWGSKALLPYFIKSECAQYDANTSVHGAKGEIYMLYTMNTEFIAGVRIGEWINCQNGPFFFSSFTQYANYDSRYIEMQRVDASYSSSRACEMLGLPSIPDLNDPGNVPIGWSRIPLTRDSNQHRFSTFRAFLPPALVQFRRNNLHICPNVLVERLNIEQEGDSLVVRSVAVGLVEGQAHTVHVGVRREVVVSAGALGSPQILMLRWALLVCACPQLLLTKPPAVLDPLITSKRLASLSSRIYQLVKIWRVLENTIIITVLTIDFSKTMLECFPTTLSR